MKQLLMTTELCLVLTVPAMASNTRLAVSMTSFEEKTAPGETGEKAFWVPFELMAPENMASYAK